MQATEAYVAALSQDAEKHDAQGHTLYHLKDYQQALQHFQVALALDPQNSVRHYWIGMSLYHLKHYEQALPYHLRALDLDPKNPSYQINAGITLLCLKHYEKARQHYVQALALDPKNIHASHNLGSVLLQLNRIDEGRDSLRKALDLAPQHICPIWMIEFCNLCFDPFDEAIITRLEHAADIEDDHQNHLKDLCHSVAFWLQQRHDLALNSAELALTIEPDCEDTFFWKGMALAALGRNEEARTALEWARENGVALCLFQTLKLLKPINESFYQQYALPLLKPQH